MTNHHNKKRSRPPPLPSIPDLPVKDDESSHTLWPMSFGVNVRCESLIAAQANSLVETVEAANQVLLELMVSLWGGENADGVHLIDTAQFEVQAKQLVHRLLLEKEPYMADNCELHITNVQVKGTSLYVCTLTPTPMFLSTIANNQGLAIVQ